MKITIELNDAVYQEHQHDMTERQLANELRSELEDRITELDETKLVRTILKKRNPYNN